MAFPFTLKSQMLRRGGRYVFHFYCDLCSDGADCSHGYTTAEIEAETVREACETARKKARLHFNRCSRCHRWVCDYHFDVDSAQCTDCVLSRILRTG